MTSFKISEIEGAVVERREYCDCGCKRYRDLTAEEMLDRQSAVRLRFNREILVKVIHEYLHRNRAHDEGIACDYCWKSILLADAIIAAGPDLLETVKE